MADYTALDIPVWFNDESLANILSLAVVRKKFRVTIDTDIIAAINVPMTYDSIMGFNEKSNELHCYDIRSKDKPLCSLYTFFNTVENDLKLYTRRGQSMTNKARILYRNSPFPGPQRYINLLDEQYFCNFPITSTAAKCTDYILGKDLAHQKKLKDHAPVTSAVAVIRLSYASMTKVVIEASYETVGDEESSLVT